MFLELKSDIFLSSEFRIFVNFLKTSNALNSMLKAPRRLLGITLVGHPRACCKQLSVFVVGKHFYGGKLTKCW